LLDAWRTPAHGAGLRALQIEQRLRRQCHADVRALMQGLRDVGACNAHSARFRHRLGRSMRRRLEAPYAPWRDAGVVPASWNIHYPVLDRRA
jgi:malonyl-CoA O-methyltransferase